MRREAPYRNKYTYTSCTQCVWPDVTCDERTSRSHATTFVTGTIPPTTHNLFALRKHKRVTIPQWVSSRNTTKRTKGTMKALSHRKLKKIYGHVSVGIMERKGCCGVALRDCSSRTQIEIANHDNTGIGFVASSVAVHRRGRRHKHRPCEECDFTTKPITFVPAQTITTLASTTTPHEPFMS